MDTMKLAPGLYQYTVVDDCTRNLVAALYPRRTATDTLEFLDHVIDHVPFPIQRLQTDIAPSSSPARSATAPSRRGSSIARSRRARPISTAKWNAPRRRCATSSTPRPHERARRWLTTGKTGSTTTTTGGCTAVWASHPPPAGQALEEEVLSWDDVLAAFDPKKESNYVELQTLSHLRAAAPKQ